MTYAGGEVKPPDFIRWMRLPSGRPPRLDLSAPTLTRSGSPTSPSRRRRAAGATSAISTPSAGKSTPPTARSESSPRLWLSEFTVQSGEDSRFFEYHVSEDEQALWLRRGYAAAEQAGDVVALGWFALLDRPAGSGHANWGLLREDGSRKPAFAPTLLSRALDEERSSLLPVPIHPLSGAVRIAPCEGVS